MGARWDVAVPFDPTRSHAHPRMGDPRSRRFPGRRVRPWGERIRVREALALVRTNSLLRRYLVGVTWSAAMRMSGQPGPQ